MDTQRPRSQSVLQHYPPTSQSRTSKFLQKVSNLKVRIRFSSNTTRNSKDIDSPTNSRAAGNGRGSLNLFHNPYPSQGHPHNPHRHTPSDDIYTYDSSVKPYMSQPSMLGNMVVEPYVPNSINNRDDEGDDADSMHLNDQTPTQTTRRFPFGRHKNSSQKSISQGLLPATSVVVGAAQARPAPRNSRRSADIPDGLPSTQTSAQPRITSRLAIDGLPHESHSPVRPPSRQKQVRPSTSPSHSQTQSYSRASPPRPSHDTHRTTPSIVISDPSESSDNGVFGNTAITQHNSHQEHQEDGQRPRSSLGSGDHTGFGHANPNNATPYAHPLSNAYHPSRSRPSSSRSTASAANSGSLNEFGRRTGSPGRPSSARSSESESSYVSAVSQLVDALDNGVASDVGHGTSSPFGSPKLTENVGGSQPPGAMAPQIPGAARTFNEATIPASSVLSGLDERSISPLPPRMESLPVPPSSSTASTPRRPRPPSRPLPLPPTENGDADLAHTLNLPRASVDGEASSRPSSRMSSTHPALESFSFPTFTPEPLASPQSPSSHVNDEDSRISPTNVQPQRPTLKQRSSSSSLKRVGQAITRKLSIGKLRRDSMGEVEGRRPSISPSLKDLPLPPIPNFPRSSSANAVPSVSTTTSKSAYDDTPKPTLRGSPPRLTLPNYSHRFSLTTFSGGAMVFSNEDTGTPTVEVPTSPGGTIGRAAGGGAKFSPSIILRPPPLPIKNLPRLPTVQGVGSFRRGGEGSESGSRRPMREGSTGTVTANDKGKDTGRARLRSMPELLLTGPSRRGTMEEEQENSEDEDDLMGESEEDEDEDDHRPRTSEERAGTALSNYTASSYDDHDGYESSRSTEPTSGRPSMSSSYRGSALLAPPSTSPTRNRRKGRKTHSRSSSYNFDASSVEGSPTNHRTSLGSDEQSLVSVDGKGKGKEKSIIRDGRPLLTLDVPPTKSTQPRSPTLDLNLGDGLDLGYILAATEQAEHNILGDEPTITSKMKGFKGKGRMQEPEPQEEEEDAIDTGKTPTASALGSGKSYYQDYFSSKEVPPLPTVAPDVKGKQPQPATPRVGPAPSPAHTPRLDGTIRGSKRFSAAIPPLPETGFVSRPSIYKHASRSMIDFHALAVKEERDKMVREEEERQEKEERARRRKSVRMSAMMLGDDEPLQHAFMAFGGGEAILEETSAPPSKRTSRVVERAADGVLARDRASIVGPRQNRMSMAPSYETVLEALKAEGRDIKHQHLTGMPLRKRRSLPTFNANTEPPPYPSFLPRTNVPIEPRDDEGRERLPAYTNHIFMCGVVPRKMEFISAGNQARDRKWRKVVCVLEGTSFKVYKHRPHGGAIGEWWRSKKNMSSANLPTSVSREESRSNAIATNKLGEREEVQVVELKATGPVPDTPTTPVTPTRAQPRLTRYSPAASSTNIASSSSSRLATSPSGPSTRSRLGNLLKPGRPHGRSQSEVANNLLTPARFPRPSLNLPSASSDSSGLASGQSFGESSQHLSVPGSSPSTRPTTPSSFMSHQRSPSRSDRRDSTSSIEELPATETTIIGIGTVGGTGPLKPPSETGELIKEYSMQHAESGLGNDYIKRINVIRIRLEGEQFLMQANNTMEVVAWIEALQASANVALDLDERPMPKGPLFPRRRRRRRRPVAEADSAAANANHTPMMVDTT